MKKILLYTPFITSGGGLQKVALSYANMLANSGYDMSVISDFNMGPKVGTYVNDLNPLIRFQYIKSIRISKFIYFFRKLGKKYKVFNMFLYCFMLIFDFLYYHLKVKNILKKEKYDVVISFYQFLPSYITNIKSSKHIIWLHGSVKDYFSGLLGRFKYSYKKKLDKYDHIVTITDEMKKQLISTFSNLSESKITRIYNPFNFEEIVNRSRSFARLSDR